MHDLLLSGRIVSLRIPDFFMIDNERRIPTFRSLETGLRDYSPLESLSSD